MLKKSASVVLASLRDSPYGGEYDSPLRSLRPCWTAFLIILWVFVNRVETIDGSAWLLDQNSFSQSATRAIGRRV